MVLNNYISLTIYKYCVCDTSLGDVYCFFLYINALLQFDSKIVASCSRELLPCKWILLLRIAVRKHRSTVWEKEKWRRRRALRLAVCCYETECFYKIFGASQGSFFLYLALFPLPSLSTFLFPVSTSKATESAIKWENGRTSGNPRQGLRCFSKNWPDWPVSVPEQPR